MLDNPPVWCSSHEEAEVNGDGSVSGGARAGRAGDVATYVSDVSEDEASGEVDGSVPRVSSLDVYRKAAKGKPAKFTGVPGSTPGQLSAEPDACGEMPPDARMPQLDSQREDAAGEALRELREIRQG